MFKAPFFSIGFRPFFAMTFVSAVLSVTVWTLQFSGLYTFNFSPLSPLQWHANEMIFGFLYAAVAGFLLTASANWTGTRGIHGGTLVALFFTFVFTRIAFWSMPFKDLVFYKMFSLAVPVFIVAYLARLFISTKNVKNLIMIIPLVALAYSQLLLLGSKYTLGYELAIFSVRFLVIVIAGRVLPFFTQKALGLKPKWGLPLLERLTILNALLLIFEPLFDKTTAVGNYFWVALTSIALVLNSYRLVNWHFVASFKVRILFVLYLAYAWLPIHFFLNLANHFDWLPALGRPELHSLVYGCMGLMIIGIINRVSLGHTGRPIRANRLARLAYTAIFAGSIARVFGPLLAPQFYLNWVKLSGGFWVAGFLAMGIAVGPMLFLARADGREY